jgi:hypothetical protein
LTTDRARAARDTAGREPPSVWGCSDAIAIMIVPTLLWISFALHADGLPTLLWSVLCSARRRTLLPAPGPAERTVRNILTLVARHARLITPRAARHRAPRRLSRARGGGGFWRPAGRAARMCRSIQRGGRLLPRRTVHCSGGPLCGQPHCTCTRCRAHFLEIKIRDHRSIRVPAATFRRPRYRLLP